MINEKADNKKKQLTRTDSKGFIDGENDEVTKNK